MPRVPIEIATITVVADGMAARPHWVFPTRYRNELLTIHMWDAAPLAGRVVDAEGRPVPRAEVFVARRDFSVMADWEGTAAADEKGEFALTTVPLGPVSLRVTADEHGLLRQDLRMPVANPVTLALPAGRPRTSSRTCPRTRR